MSRWQSGSEATEECQTADTTELVNCPDGSQAATTEECPTAAAPTELVNCPDGSSGSNNEECGLGSGDKIAPSAEFPNVLWGDYFYANPLPI